MPGVRPDSDVPHREGSGISPSENSVFPLQKYIKIKSHRTLPGLGLVSDEAIAARFAQKDAHAAMDLLRQAPDSVQIGASCSSVFLLAQTGLLSGRHATMTLWLAKLFRARYMIQAHTQQVDPTVIAAERWIDTHLSEPISITALAAALAVSPKTLARRIDAATGVSPVKFIQRRRLVHVAHLIASTSLSIEAIAAKVGYQDGTALRKLVRREFGTTPAALRE
jgi:transcriptional regulator GlxA family with amidase domain